MSVSTFRSIQSQLLCFEIEKIISILSRMKGALLLAALGVIILSVTVTGKRVLLARAGGKSFYTTDGEDSISWDEAVAACAKEGLKTAVISNAAESQALEKAALERAKADKQQYLWLGAILKNGKWVWAANNRELKYRNWEDGAILNDPGTTPTQGYNCGYISASPRWKTWACGDGSRNGYLAAPVCQ